MRNHVIYVTSIQKIDRRVDRRSRATSGSEVNRLWSATAHNRPEISLDHLYRLKTILKGL